MRSAKTLFKSLLAVLLLSMTRCETEKLIFTGPYHVRFTEASAFEKESFSGVIQIEVHYVGPAPKQDVTLGYTIGGNAREGVDYVILEERKKVKILKGEYFGFIKIQLIIVMPTK